MGMGDGGLINQAIQAVGLEAPFVFVELGTADAAPPAGFGDVAQFLGQFQDPKSFASLFLFSHYYRLARSNGTTTLPISMGVGATRGNGRCLRTKGRGRHILRY